MPVAGVDSNYNMASGPSPWNIGCGSEELNGTFDMMGNVWELMESPFYSGVHLSGSSRGRRGGSYGTYDSGIILSYRGVTNPSYEDSFVGFRVASVPEPTTILLLSLGGFILRRRKQ